MKDQSDKKPLSTLFLEIDEKDLESLDELGKQFDKEVGVDPQANPLSMDFVEQPAKEKIIVPIDEYFALSKPAVKFKTYFELEGGVFPDLFPRYEESDDDVDSKIDVISPTRAGKIYSNLLTAAIKEETKKSSLHKEDFHKQSKNFKVTNELMEKLMAGFHRTKKY